MIGVVAFDQIQRGALHLARRRGSHISREVRYGRKGDGSPVTATATIIDTTYDLEDRDGVIVQVTSRDFLIAPSELQAEPVRGDQIRESRGGAVRVYEVTDLGDKPHWEWADTAYTAYRIHTKFIREETT